MIKLLLQSGFTLGIFCIIFFASCGNKPNEGPSMLVTDLVGKAVISFSSQQPKTALPGMAIPVGSIISIGSASRITVSYQGIAIIAGSENTAFCVDSIISRNGRNSFFARIFDGRILCAGPTVITSEAMRKPVRFLLPDQNAFLFVRAGKQSLITVVKTLGSSASVEASQGQLAPIPSCCKALVNSDGAVSSPLPLNDKDFADIEPLLGKVVSDSLIKIAGCPQTMAAQINAPPRWTRSPVAECMAGKMLTDTLSAQDPEGTSIIYHLLNGPKGMTVDSLSGIARFTPKKAGVYPVEVAAIDSAGLCANMNYELSAIGEIKKNAPRKPNAVISMQSMAAPGDSVVIDASRSNASASSQRSLKYRFDISGEVIGNRISKDGFIEQPKVTYAFKTEGNYTIHVRVKAPNGQTAIAHCDIIIRLKPVAVITLSTQEFSANKEYVLDAGKSLAGKTAAPLKFRWDLDNNGTWDFPSGGVYTGEKTVKKTWSAPGHYQVVLEIIDKYEEKAWASADIEVKFDVNKTDTSLNKRLAASTAKPEPKPAVVQAGGRFQTRACKPITLDGSASAPGNEIVSFAWDFDGDGKYDTTYTTQLKIEHSYCKAGSFKAVFRVTTADTKEWFDTASVTVVNCAPIAHAGRHFFSKKGRTVTLHGTGEDYDDGIALYEWDFNNDGVYDWSSPKTGEVEHKFDAYSTAALRVTDHNGATGRDTIRVVICPEGMVEVEQGPFCIDEYEWPNQKGKFPDREMTYETAVKQCAAAGKRLCSGKEWEQACAGVQNRQFPTSNALPTQNCNIIGNHAFSNKIAPSGSFSDCQSPAGAYDMNGNVAEWTSGTPGDSAFVYGGSWHNDLANATCSSKLLLKKTLGYFYVGFRCCK